MSNELHTEELVNALNDFENWVKDEMNKKSKIDGTFMLRFLSKTGSLILPLTKHTIQLEKEVTQLKDQLSKK